MDDPVIIRGTGTDLDGQLADRSHLPIGVLPDRFGVVRFRATGTFDEVEGVVAEVLVPDL
jgi:hypothetical protein